MSYFYNLLKKRKQQKQRIATTICGGNHNPELIEYVFFNTQFCFFFKERMLKKGCLEKASQEYWTLTQKEKQSMETFSE